MIKINSGHTAKHTDHSDHTDYIDYTGHTDDRDHTDMSFDIDFKCIPSKYRNLSSLDYTKTKSNALSWVSGITRVL